MSAKSPAWAEILDKAVRLRLASLRVCMPAKIEEFDSETQLATVKPLIPEVEEDSDGQISQHSLPVIYNVPVVFEGTDNFYLTYPIQKGDRCEIRFTDRSYDAWMTNGDDLEPGDDRRHDLTDAVAVMGLRDQSRKITEFDTNRPAMGKKNGPKLSFSDSFVEIGGDHNENVANFAALANLVKERLDAIQQKFDAHTHTVSGIKTSGTPAAQSQVDPVTSSGPGSTIGTLASVAASKVKVK